MSHLLPAGDRLPPPDATTSGENSGGTGAG